MSVTELDTFVHKFYQLWNAGLNAHLDVDTHAGKAWVGLRVQLGHAPGPLHHQPHPLFVQPQKKTVTPSRHRRRARRAAARLTAEEAVNQEPSNETATAKEATDNEIVEETFPKEPNTTADKAAEAEASEAVQDKSAEQARNDSPCLICDFVSSWETGLKIHMTRKHLTVEQVDGNATLTDDDIVEDDKYSDTCHYWKTGILGTSFQTFLDANEIIDSSNFSEEIKEIEKAKVLEARKFAFGENYEYVPPWNHKR